MHIFIDESGTFSDFRNGSISAVGALILPDGKLRHIEKKFTKMKSRLPQHNGEIKGKLLNETQIAEIVTLLACNDAIFECCFVDMGVLDEANIMSAKKAHAEHTASLAKTIALSQKDMVERTGNFIRDVKLPQYVQALVTFNVIHGVLQIAPTYFAQRQPKELGEFSWLVDGKDKSKTNEWELWWSNYAAGALATMSERWPMPIMSSGADFSYLNRYNLTTVGKDGIEYEGFDMSLMLQNLIFSAVPQCGLELVDILVNATRRALIGHLQEQGYRDIRRLMLHRRDEGGLRLFNITTGDDEGIKEVRVPYAPVVRHFLRDGRNMFTKNTLRLARKEEKNEVGGGGFAPP